MSKPKPKSQKPTTHFLDRWDRAGGEVVALTGCGLKVLVDDAVTDPTKVMCPGCRASVPYLRVVGRRQNMKGVNR
jgi:hypothetical protein